MAVESEIELVSEFKKRFKDDVERELYEDDRFFYRFLKTCHFSTHDAEIMLKKHLEVREKYANILECELPTVIRKYVHLIKLGYDKEGSVVRYCPAGSIDWIGVVLSTRLEDLVRMVIRDIEEDSEDRKRQSEKLGKAVGEGVYIYDLDGLPFAQATDKRVVLNSLSVLDLYQKNYPERLKTVYIINASVYFSWIVQVLRSLVSKSIVEKIKVYSDDSYKEDLLKTIDEDVLPGFLGGNRTDADGNPSCRSFIRRGETVPEAFYIHKSKRSLAHLPDVEKITLTRASFHEIFNEVKDPGSFLEWEFETRSRDVGFGVFYRADAEGTDQMEEVVPLQRIDTEDYSEHGMCRCENAGTYVIVFDNTYSWVRAKEIYYRVKIVTPEELKKKMENE